MFSRSGTTGAEIGGCGFAPFAVEGCGVARAGAVALLEFVARGLGLEFAAFAALVGKVALFARTAVAEAALLFPCAVFVIVEFAVGAAFAVELTVKFPVAVTVEFVAAVKFPVTTLERGFARTASRFFLGFVLRKLAQAATFAAEALVVTLKDDVFAQLAFNRPVEDGEFNRRSKSDL